MVTIDSQ